MAAGMFVCGARVGEATKFRSGDYDPDEGTLVALSTKNKEDHVYILPDRVNKMVALIAPYNEDAKLFGYSSRHSVYEPWKTTCKAAGIDYISPHNMGRRTMATQIVTRQRHDIKVAQELGNWKSDRTLRKEYVQVEKRKKLVNDIFPEPDFEVDRNFEVRLFSVSLS